MKSFLGHLALFAALQGMILAVVLASYRVNPDEYFAVSIDKHARLRSTPGARVVIIGGSNTAFGFDSSLLESRLGRPVVNLGLHAGLGDDYILREAEGELRQGDVAVVSLEYEHFVQDGTDGSYLLRLVWLRPEAMQEFGFGQWKAVLDTSSYYLSNALRASVKRWAGQSPPALGPVYRRSGFNAWGDMVAHYSRKPQITPAQLGGAIGRYDSLRFHDAMRRLEQFAQQMQARGVHAAFCYPSIPQERLKRHEPLVQQIAQRIEQTAHLTVLNDPSDMAFGAEQFYDTYYHLTQEGVRQRSERVAAELQAIVARDTVGAPNQDGHARAPAAAGAMASGG